MMMENKLMIRILILKVKKKINSMLKNQNH